MPSDNCPARTRRDHLLEAASQLFARWGVDKTSVDEIASTAGVSKGAVYLEFKDKESLLRAVLAHEWVCYLADWKANLEAERGDWSFLFVYHQSLASMNARPLIRALFSHDQRVYGAFLRHHPELLTLGITMRHEMLAALQKAAVLRDDVDPGVVAYLLTVINYGLITAVDAFEESATVPFDTALLALGQVLDRGLAPSRPPRPGVIRRIVLRMIGQMQVQLGGGAVHQVQRRRRG